MADASAARFYEIRCPHCETSFPPEARRCLHCGRRLGGGLLRGAAAAAPAEHPVVREGAGPPAEEAGAPGLARPAPLPASEGEEELEGRGSSGLLWVATAVLAVVGSALRVCQGG